MAEDRANKHSRVAVELGTEDRPVLVRWSTIWRPGRYSPFDSYALRTKDGWVLIDPEEPTSAAMDRLEDLIRQEPVATVLTSDGHERSCYAARAQWGASVWGPTTGGPGEAQ